MLRIGQATCPHCGYKTTTGGISEHIKNCPKKQKAIPEEVPIEVMELKKAIRALFLEVPFEVADDVRKKAEAVINLLKPNT